jgi:hypothetical protein
MPWRRPWAQVSRHPKWWIAAVAVALALGWVAWVGLLPVLGPAAPGVRPPAAVACTIHAPIESMPPVEAGDVVCLSGTTRSELAITTGGTVDNPVTYSGDGTTTVEGLEIEASNVV